MVSTVLEEHTCRDTLYAPPVWVSEDEPNDGFMYLHAPRHMARHDPELAEAVHLIAEYSDLGCVLINKAKKGYVQFERAELNPTTSGKVINQTVSLNFWNNIEDIICTLPHELMHWIQNAKQPVKGWGIKSRLINSFTKEAAAESCAAHVTHELYYKGIKKPLDNILYSPEWINYSGIHRAFDNAAYLAYTTNSGNPMLIASDAAFYSYFGQKNLVNNYARITLAKHLEAINGGLDVLTTRAFDAGDAEYNARIEQGRYLVMNRVRLPDIDDLLFSKALHLRHAFEYAALEHFTAVRGHSANDTDVIRSRNILKDRGNPFVGLNVADIMEHYFSMSKSGVKADALEAMLELTSLERV
jgi:hypothetical protein